jgi:hypothetical protein
MLKARSADGAFYAGSSQDAGIPRVAGVDVLSRSPRRPIAVITRLDHTPPRRAPEFLLEARHRLAFKLVEQDFGTL